MNQNKKKIIRIDFIFSYWILFWFIGYQLKIVPFNPKDAITIAICANIIMLLFLIYNKSSAYNIFKFSSINSVFKLIPFLLLYNTKTTAKDNYFFLFLLSLYIIWIYSNQVAGSQTMYQTFDDIFIAYMKNGVKNNKQTILNYYYDSGFNYLYKKFA